MPTYRIRQYTDSWLEFKIEADSVDQAKAAIETGTIEPVTRRRTFCEPLPVQPDDIEEIVTAIDEAIQSLERLTEEKKFFLDCDGESVFSFKGTEGIRHFLHHSKSTFADWKLINMKSLGCKEITQKEAEGLTQKKF